MTEYRFAGRWTPEDRRAALYRSLLFDLPSDATGLVIEIDYAKTPRAALDVGLSDPRGFRGWSGSSRKRIELSNEHATPGYLAGDLPSGAWAVELGLHRVPEEGLAFEVRIGTNDPVKLAAPKLTLEATPHTTRDLPAPDGLRWIPGDLRAHSEHSDGTEPLADLADRAVRAGLGFLVVADFNTISHYDEIAAINASGKILLVPGQTVATDTGHAAVLGRSRWIDLRTAPADWAGEVWADGGIVSVNHPVKADSGWVTPLGRRVDMAEVWTGGWDQRDLAALAWWMAAGPEVVPVGGSGWTGPDSAGSLGSPTTWVLTENDDVIDGLRHGRTAITATPDGPLLLPVGQELIVLGGAGLHLVAWDGSERRIYRDEERFPLPSTPTFLRDADRTVAISAGSSAGTSGTREESNSTPDTAN